MHETELWITRLFNDLLPGLGNTLTGIVGMPPEARPWANFVTMQLLVALIIVVLFAILKPRLSACFWIAAPMSPRATPGRTIAMPFHMHS